MKKLLFLSFYSLIGIHLNAQENTLGIKTGLGRSTLKTDYAGSDSYFDSKGKLSAYVAVFAEHKLNENWALQGEIGLSIVGGRNVFYKDGHSENVNAITLGKLNIPLMIKYYFNEKVNVNAGIAPSFILETMSKDRNNGKIFSNIFGDEIDIKKYVKVFEVNPFVGIEFYLSKKIFLDARYTFGIYNIGKEFQGEGFDVLKSSSLQFGVGFKFKK